jgi:hypothetical protein
MIPTWFLPSSGRHPWYSPCERAEEIERETQVPSAAKKTYWDRRCGLP